MLSFYTQFVARQAIKSPVFLLSPRVFLSNLIEIPKDSTLHYLDTEHNLTFPSRELSYFKNISSGKKIPIHHVEDLIEKEGTTSLKNKYLRRDIKQWTLKNLKQFRTVDLIENPSTDATNVAVFNYGLLPELYNYSSSLYADINKYQNLYRTYFFYVKKYIEVNPTNHQFVSVELPHAIPSYFIVDKLIQFNAIKYARVVKTTELKLLIDIYKWLTNTNRKTSIMKDITDEESNNIVIEFKYKGYSCFLPLHIIRSVSIESALPSKLKLNNDKLHKLFVMFLLRIQNYVNSELDKEQRDIEPDEELDQQLQAAGNEDETEEPITPNEQSNIQTTKPIEVKGFFTKEKPLDIDGITFDKEGLDVSDNIYLINRLINKSVDNDEVDILFKETMVKVDSEPTDQVEDEETHIRINRSEEHIEQVLQDLTKKTKITKYIDEAVEFKTLTSLEIRNIRKLEEERSNLKTPYGNKTPIDEFKQIDLAEYKLTDEEITIGSNNTKVNITLAKDPIKAFNKKYIENILHKDIVSVVLKLEDSGLIVKSYDVEQVISAVDKYEMHRLTIKPLDGKESTIYFRVPILDSEGRFMVSGVKYIMRKQKTDLPIRKISPIKVALTSNYSKLFIARTERKAFDSYGYVSDFIKKSYMEGNGNIVAIELGNTYDNLKVLPTMFSHLTNHFVQIELKEYTLVFDLDRTQKFIEQKTYEQILKQQLIPIGYVNSDKTLLVINYDNEVFTYTSPQLTSIGSIPSLLNIDLTKLPVNFSTIKVLGKDIPLGPVLGYYIGISNLISILKIQIKYIEANKQYKLTEHEYMLKFKDYKVILNKRDKEAFLLFSGFIFFKDYIKTIRYNDLNDRNTYLALFEFRDYMLIHLKELDLLRELFLDPITVSVLKEINEPITYLPLLLRANELLTTHHHPDINDADYSRIRLYDRVPAMVYKGLAEAVREYKFKYSAKSKINIDPYKIWNLTTQDNTVKITEDINPIMDLKEVEAVTLTGGDGLSKDAMPEGLRKYHRTEMGLISEATVDSSDVGINTYLTPFAKFDSTRGLTKKNKVDYKENKAQLLSTSALLSPFILHDDPKRVNFVNVQNSHVIATEGYQQPSIRTEYEYILPYRVSSLFCFIAEEDGKVTELTNKLITIEYTSGKVKAFSIGTVLGRAEGSIYTHNLVTDLKLNSKFNKNDYIYYNSSFFEKDWLDNKVLIPKMSRMVTVALSMTNNVYEDSSAISIDVSKQMSTPVVKEKSFVIEFTNNVINLLPENTHVEPNDILFTILDEHTDYTNLEKNTIQMLQTLTNISPKAKLKGEILRYEVRYNGDIADMSPTLKKLVTKINKDMYDRTKGTEYEIKSGKVSSEYRVGGKNLLLDTLELKVYITTNISAGVGDKGVFSTQLKSVIADVYTHKVTTDSGDTIDAFFGYKSILNRITLSPLITGMLNRLLRLKSKTVADIYFE